MFRKLIANVIFCVLIVNVVNVKIQQDKRKGLQMALVQKGNENDFVKICFEDGKCTEMKYNARHLSPNEHIALKGGFQMQKERSQSEKETQ